MRPLTYIRGELVLRVAGQDTSLGHIDVAVNVQSTSNGDLNLTANTREVREFVETVFIENATGTYAVDNSTAHGTDVSADDF